MLKQNMCSVIVMTTYTTLYKKTISLFLYLEQKLGQAVQLECYKSHMRNKDMKNNVKVKVPLENCVRLRTAWTHMDG